jgi:hypothetical protein
VEPGYYEDWYKDSRVLNPPSEYEKACGGGYSRPEFPFPTSLSASSLLSLLITTSSAEGLQVSGTCFQEEASACKPK